MGQQEVLQACTIGQGFIFRGSGKSHGNARLALMELVKVWRAGRSSARFTTKCPFSNGLNFADALHQNSYSSCNRKVESGAVLLAPTSHAMS